ncbi:MAG: hypothetical protein ACT4P4_19735 [Betaproteobacteria bacterium]
MNKPAEMSDEIVDALRHFHGALVAVARQEYQRDHGAVVSTGDLLQLLVNDPHFDWLRPLSQLIAELDHLPADGARKREEVLLIVLARAKL